jgi:hypothetical protein
VSELPHLRGLKLAHPETGEKTFTISMLIGADFFWDVVEDQVIRGNGPTAVKSKIGYLLSGPIRTQTPRAKDHMFNIIASHSSTDIEIIAEQDRREFIKKVDNDSSVTYVSSNSANLKPLKPSHLFFGRKMTSPPYHEHYTDNDIALLQSDRPTLTNHAKTQTKNICQFKKRRKYLTALREHHNITGSSEEHMRVGDVVAKVKTKHGQTERKTTGNY